MSLYNTRKENTVLNRLHIGHTYLTHPFIDWGADCIVLLRLYYALLCSKLDYGCVVYGSAHQAIGSDPSSGLAYCIQGFRNISCPKSVHGSTETVPGLLPSKTELIDNVSCLDIAPVSYTHLTLPTMAVV